MDLHLAHTSLLKHIIQEHNIMGTIAIKGLGKAFLKGRANPKKVKGDMETNPAVR